MTLLADLLCRTHCSYFKPEKVEAEHCGGYDWLAGRPAGEVADWLEALGGCGSAPRLAADDLLSEAICAACPFRVDGCDYRDPACGEGAEPCGGLLALDALLERGMLSAGALVRNPFLCLATGVHTKRLETPGVYDARSDDLYELDPEAFRLLRACDGTRRQGELDPEAGFLATCLEEGLLERLAERSPRRLSPDAPSLRPSLRYLEVQLTSRCNLACAHCCLGEPGAEDLPVGEALDALAQLERAQGLRVLLTGGEPLLHPRFWEIHERLGEFALRFVLLTNGTLVTAEVARRLGVHEVQVSLDGLEPGHDALRGRGSHRRALAGLRALVEAGMQVSVSTMVHRANLSEFDGMARELEGLGVREWGVDVPCTAGRWAGGSELAVTPEEAAASLGYAFGGSAHGGSSGAGCGEHLATLTPSGLLLRCGFFPGQPLGTLDEGLEVAWSRRRSWDLAGTRCEACDAFAECGGGCRYRAGGPRLPDPVMCAVFLPSDGAPE